jgi:DNA polymerase-3 subunit delta'
VTLVPLVGHETLQNRLRTALQRGSLPASLLLHGPRGVGKQRAALWLARLLLCHSESAITNGEACGECTSCRFTANLTHPDLHWIFPRPRLKDAALDPDEARADYAEAIAERVESGGLYETPGGDEGIFVAAIRALVQSATISPAMGKRKVLVVGDAERMIAQEGAETAANAFLKLLEEPPADTTIVLTSSEPGSLLPTIRSRVVAMRVAPVSEQGIRSFLSDPQVRHRLELGTAPEQRKVDELVGLSAGAPGRLLSYEAAQNAIAEARRLLEAARSPDRGQRMRAALGQGVSKARGRFSDTLDALTAVLHESARTAAERGDEAAAVGAARAVEIVEDSKAHAAGNVNPQLVAASLMTRMGVVLR